MDYEEGITPLKGGYVDVKGRVEIVNNEHVYIYSKNGNYLGIVAVDAELLNKFKEKNGKFVSFRAIPMYTNSNRIFFLHII